MMAISKQDHSAAGVSPTLIIMMLYFLFHIIEVYTPRMPSVSVVCDTATFPNHSIHILSTILPIYYIIIALSLLFPLANNPIIINIHVRGYVGRIATNARLIPHDPPVHFRWHERYYYQVIELQHVSSDPEFFVFFQANADR